MRVFCPKPLKGMFAADELIRMLHIKNRSTSIYNIEKGIGDKAISHPL
jgi:hypothetical protein